MQAIPVAVRDRNGGRDRHSDCTGHGRNGDAAHSVDVLYGAEELRGSRGSPSNPISGPRTHQLARDEPKAHAAARNRRVSSSQTTRGATNNFAAIASPTDTPAIAARSRSATPSARGTSSRT